MNLLHESVEITNNTNAAMMSSDIQKLFAGFPGKVASKPNYGGTHYGKLIGNLSQSRRPKEPEACPFDGSLIIHSGYYG